jgi:hypothetical protein
LYPRCGGTHISESTVDVRYVSAAGRRDRQLVAG